MGARALFGATGFVGQALRAQAGFDLFLSRANASEIAGTHLDELVLCGLPAEKWRANRDPAADLANVRRVMDLLRTVRADRVVLISTVDVYAQARDVDESSTSYQTAPGYGAHRRLFEAFVTQTFPRALVARLPALFGDGLKKNYLFDLLHGNEVHKIALESSFQWYPVDRLWSDIARLRDAGIGACNLVTEPIATRELVTRWFPERAGQCADAAGSHYDVGTGHARAFGLEGRYMMRAPQVQAALGDWLARARGTTASPARAG